MQQYRLKPNEGQIQVSVQSLNPGVYVVQALDDRNQLMAKRHGQKVRKFRLQSI